jgi:hypothetical protein
LLQYVADLAHKSIHLASKAKTSFTDWRLKLSAIDNGLQPVDGQGHARCEQGDLALARLLSSAQQVGELGEVHRNPLRVIVRVSIRSGLTARLRMGSAVSLTRQILEEYDLDG